MPLVEAFSIAGLDLWFNSADHKPPHIHAEKSGVWEVRIYFLRDRAEVVEVKWGNPRAGEVKRLVLLAEAHRVELLEEWERKVVVKDPGPDR
jgi:hypothetical protein